LEDCSPIFKRRSFKKASSQIVCRGERRESWRGWKARRGVEREERRVKSDERSLNDDVDLGSELLRFSESEFYAYSSFQSKAHVRMISSAEA